MYIAMGLAVGGRTFPKLSVEALDNEYISEHLQEQADALADYVIELHATSNQESQ